MNNLEVLVKCQHWFADATFKSAPRLFRQLFVIHGLWNGIVLPLVYVLMSSKTEEQYDKLFDVLQELKPELYPLTIMTDFERASLKAFKNAFPHSKQRCCFFHYMQSLFRNVQKEKVLLEKVLNDPSFRFYLKFFGALAFVPLNRVIEYYEFMVNLPFFIENSSIYGPFLSYFEETWIGKKRRANRRPPLFEMKTWNVHEAVKNDWARTNNHCEGFHRGFSSLLSGDKPNFWKFIEGLKKEQGVVEIKIAKITSGNDHNPTKRSRDYTENLKRIVLDFDNRDIMTFLSGISSLIDFTD